MRFIISLLLISFFALTSCAQGTAGVTIPAGQTFVLGEYRATGYRATMRNTGNQAITAAVVDQQSGAAVTTVNLSVGQRETVSVGDGQEVHLINKSEQQALVKVNSPVSGQQGMRYVGATNDDAPGENEKPTRIVLPRSASSTSTAPAAAPETTTSATLQPGEALIIGEGTSSGFTANIRNSGGQIDVAGRNKTSGKQTQGFGLLKMGRETVNVRTTEDLYLINTSGKPTKVTVKMDRPVRGVRVVKM